MSYLIAAIIALLGLLKLQSRKTAKLEAEVFLKRQEKEYEKAEESIRAARKAVEAADRDAASSRDPK